MAGKIKVAVLMGGVSGEHEVSLRSGAGVLANLKPDRYVGRVVVIGKDGRWSFDGGPPDSLTTVLPLVQEWADVAFLALHGPNGEDGTMQSLCHLVGLPFTGSDHYASSLAMNKPRAKDCFSRAGLLVAEERMVYRRDLAAGPRQVAAEVMAALGRPAVAKTTRLGSSVGVGIAADEEELASLLEQFMGYSGEVMVERFVRGTEVTAPVIDHPGGRGTEALPLIEIRPRLSGWFDYRAKYEVGGSEEICPAPLSPELTDKCRRIGLDAHRALGCRGMSRTDIIIDNQERCFVIETNTIPGFTQTSLLPQSAAAAGISYPELVDIIIREALERTTADG